MNTIKITDEDLFFVIQQGITDIQQNAPDYLNMSDAELRTAYLINGLNSLLGKKGLDISFELCLNRASNKLEKV